MAKFLDPADPSSKIILVVDDDETIQELFHTVLIRQGFRVKTVSSGDQALQIIKPGGFMVDLVVLDLMMPGRGGYDVLKELQIRCPEIPIFIITARALDSGTIQMISMESNVREFFPKPVDMKQFNAKVHETLGTQPKKNIENWQG